MHRLQVQADICQSAMEHWAAKTRFRFHLCDATGGR